MTNPKYLTTLIAVSLLVLAGCTSTNSDPNSEVSLDDGDGSIVVEFPDFASAGEEGEVSSEAWIEFAGIADESKFRLLEEGGTEYFGMYNEPYYMVYDPAFPEGKNWTVYYYENDGTVDIRYDVFEMGAYNAGLELYLYGDVADRPISGAGVSLNPDGTYTVSVKEQGYSLRYVVEDGLIVGRAVWDETSETFLGYSNISYGITDSDRELVNTAYKFAVEAGADFSIPEDSQVVEELPEGAISPEADS